MRITGAAAPLAFLRALLLQNAALKQCDKSRSHTAKGPGIMPHRKTQPLKVYLERTKDGRHLLKSSPKSLPRLARATGINSLDWDTEYRRNKWLQNQKTHTA